MSKTGSYSQHEVMIGFLACSLSNRSGMSPGEWVQEAIKVMDDCDAELLSGFAKITRRIEDTYVRQDDTP